MKITKLKVLLISFVLVGFYFLIAGTKMLTFWCGVGHLDCQDNLDSFSDYLVLFFPILLFSIITYFLKEGVFKAWLKFAYWYFPIYILVILFLSDRGSGGYLMGPVFNSEFFALTLSGLFVIISLILVIGKAVFSKGSKK